jgi:hypothetical protein
VRGEGRRGRGEGEEGEEEIKLNEFSDLTAKVYKFQK